MRSTAVFVFILAVLVSNASAQTSGAWKFDAMAGNRFHTGSWRVELGKGSSIQIGVMRVGRINVHLMGQGGAQIFTIETRGRVREKWVLIDERGLPRSADTGPNLLGQAKYLNALRALPDEKLRMRILEALQILTDAERFFNGLVLIV